MRAVSDAIAAKIPGITVKVVQSVADLPGSTAPSNTEGVHYAGTTVYLVADNLGTSERVQQALAHEAIGHAALEDMLGTKLMNELIQNIKNLEAIKNKAVVAAAATVDATQSGLKPAQRAKEIIAVMAENGEYLKSSTWQRMMAAIRSFLKNIPTAAY